MDLQLFLFTTDLGLAQRAEAAGIDSVIVDWESRGKDARQVGRDLEINCDSPEDAYRLARHLEIPVTVRINGPGNYGADEVECALENGAAMLILPMATTPREVADFVDTVKDRARTIIQIETQSLVERLAELKELNWDYAYIGLNDLMVSRGGHRIWDALHDGTVEHVYRTLAPRAVGMGGATVVGGGDPIPFTLLLHEMSRLGCRLTFLRRTFRKEIRDRELALEIRAIRALWEASRQRGPDAVRSDHEDLLRVLQQA